MPSRTAKFLILIHCCLSLGGLLIHLKLHPPTKSLFFLWASPVSTISLFVIPLLYWRPSTVGWGVLLNFFSVAIGVIGMTYFSIHTLEAPYTVIQIIMQSTFADSILLLAKIPLAFLVLQEVRFSPANAKKRS